MKTGNNNGFIYVFLMILVVFIGIMSAIAIPRFMNSQMKRGNCALAGQIADGKTP